MVLDLTPRSCELSGSPSLLKKTYITNEKVQGYMCVSKEKKKKASMAFDIPTDGKNSKANPHEKGDNCCPWCM